MLLTLPCTNCHSTTTCSYPIVVVQDYPHKNQYNTQDKMKRSGSRRKRSLSEPMIVGGHQGNAKLSKPPKVEALHERPRNRLQKRSTASNLLIPYPTRLGFTTPTKTLHVLEEEPYPYNTLPSKFLGVYSTIDSVTNGAIEHGAYTFSRGGLLDGREYLSVGGRIRIHTQVLRESGTEAAVSLRSQSLDERSPRQSGPVRADIPHPHSKLDTASPGAQSMTSLRDVGNLNETVYLAVRQGPIAAHCLGIFARPGLAWGACLKDKASCALVGTLSEESRDIDADGMPRATARLHGCGQHVWFVTAKEVDAIAR